MGTSSPRPREAGLFSRTRSSLLALLYGQADESFHLRQLVRTIGGGHGALQRELRHLTNLGLIVRTARANQVLYQANSQSPIFSEVRGLVAKTVGISDAIRSALAILGAKVEVALVYGSVARQQEQVHSDVDLMVLGEATFGEVVSALATAQMRIDREINPNVFPIAEFRSKLKAGNHFLKSIMTGKNLFVIGTRNDLARLAAK